ncbi:hypothetical protein LSCM4_02826 [Leishmania orientalis]|uniref:Uncharacterized protein n=1 Tax=Leishmania orientalis TaxID=2249476 RepID=A0A836GLX7_9TRYP|nr:hypothetical protein LSCM4_02826 [Leishmania orientalis]
MTTCFRGLREEQRGRSMNETERITHMIPVLKPLHPEDAEKAAENSGVMAAVRRLREKGGPDSVQLHTIRWCGETEASIRAQLEPVLLHYRAQILFVHERTRRRVLECQELNERVPLVAEYYQTTPLKCRLMAYRSDGASVVKPDSENILNTAASVVTCVSEARRDQQFSETFERFGSAIQYRAIASRASSVARESAVSPSGFSSLEAKKMMPFSPPLRIPHEYDVKAPTGNGVAEDAFDSTLYRSCV